MDYVITCRMCRHFVGVLSTMTMCNQVTGEFEKAEAYHCNALGLPIPTIIKISCRYFEKKEDV